MRSWERRRASSFLTHRVSRSSFRPVVRAVVDHLVYEAVSLDLARLRILGPKSGFVVISQPGKDGGFRRLSIIPADRAEAFPVSHTLADGAHQGLCEPRGSNLSWDLPSDRPGCRNVA